MLVMYGTISLYAAGVLQPRENALIAELPTMNARL